MNFPLALIVEDDNMLADFFETAIKDAGYDTNVIKNGMEALNHLETAVPDLILLDLQLPGTNGETILKAIRADDRFTNTRVFLTSVEGTRVGFYQDKVDMVLIKPVSYKQLCIIAKRMVPKSLASG
jgi:DNA-binding response OmpR family regulator